MNDFGGDLTLRAGADGEAACGAAEASVAVEDRLGGHHQRGLHRVCDAVGGPWLCRQLRSTAQSSAPAAEGLAGSSSGQVPH